MPDPPRRILEKSRTVRRRYQRSNKRFQFTASQIERIEREEERERRAQKLREKEKRRIANKKKKAEKEAREREERRRLGLPDPNAPKVPASQPLLLNFFGKKKEPEQAPQPTTAESTERESSQQEDTEVETEAEDWFDGDGDEDHIEHDVLAPDDPLCSGTSNGTSRDSIESVSADSAHGQGVSHQATTATMKHADCEENVNHNEKCSGEPSVAAHDSASSHLLSLGDSFLDETAILLEDLDPDTLQLSGEAPENGKHSETDISRALQSQSETSLTSHSIREPLSKPGGSSARPSPKKDCPQIAIHMASPNGVNESSPKKAERGSPEPFVIYQDPEDVVAYISTQDLMEAEDDAKDDYKENWHPNIPYGPQQRQQPGDMTPRRRPKPFNELQTRAERQPLMTLSQAPETPADEASKKKSPFTTRTRRDSSPTPVARKRLVAGNAGRSASTSSPAKGSLMSNEDKEEEDEFGEFDLTMEELEALCA
ncbi:hypothetical protein VTN77DRAFT_7916 [Rasamsonia byssochlamydoides]|uniref:uncharacterized protein n=1 Tax=Rasamsonia byssochlamydoides TaxID=89139 RepID=UPI0037425A2A